MLIAASCLHGLPMRRHRTNRGLHSRFNLNCPGTAPITYFFRDRPQGSRRHKGSPGLRQDLYPRAGGSGRYRDAETTARVRMLADAGVKQMAVLAFTYTASNQQVDIAYVRVLKPDGTVVVTPGYNIQDLPADVTREAPMYSDIHQKHVAVKGLGVGDTLEYQMTLRTLKPDVPGQFWLEYTFEKDHIVLDEQLDLDLPADKPVTVDQADIQPTVLLCGAEALPLGQLQSCAARS